MRPVAKNYKMHFGWNQPYPDNLKYLSSDGLHKGQDYLTPTGTTVIASVDGIVNFTGWKRGFGNCVYIKFFTGNILNRSIYRCILAHLYCINTELIVGQKINKWAEIGKSGDSGMAKNHPHLHFQVDQLINKLWVPVSPYFVTGDKP